MTTTLMVMRRSSSYNQTLMKQSIFKALDLRGKKGNKLFEARNLCKQRSKRL